MCSATTQPPGRDVNSKDSTGIQPETRSPLQLIAVICHHTLAHQAQTQDGHQLAVKSCVSLVAEHKGHRSEGRTDRSDVTRHTHLTGLQPVTAVGDVEEDFEDLHDAL